MGILKINVNNKIAESINDCIVCGNSDYIIEFAFDEEWQAYNVKTARFIYNNTAVDVVFEGNRVAVPVIKNATVVAVGAFAGDLHTTTPALISCSKSILCEKGLPPDPTPEVYAQIMELLNKGGGSGQGFTTDETLTLENGVLKVNTAKEVEADNTLPVTAAAVNKTVGNIEILLGTI